MSRCKHGGRKGRTKTTEYMSWDKMVYRCHNAKAINFPRYGGKGIRVCDRWRKFINFLADMGPKPSPFHSIDRFPNRSGNYEPGNCRWATRIEQGRGKSNNRSITFGGETMLVVEWSERLRIKAGTISNRIDRLGWSIERALTTTPRPRRKAA